MVKKARQIISLLGPAFVAAVAYVDPGNFAANISAGAEYSYALLWVLVMANFMATIVQYTSAKVGIVTGKDLPQLIATKLSKKWRVAYWLQAELVAIATDLAEVIGGAIALNMLFGIPLLGGAIITGLVSLLLLAIYSRRGQKTFERIVVGVLLIIPIGFIIGLIMQPPNGAAALGGLVPTLRNADMVLLATAMLGATVMPHVVYLHSALTRDRHGKVAKSQISSLLRATKIDVVIAMVVAGSVNIMMLLLAASSLQGMPGSDSLQSIYIGIEHTISPLVAWLFGLSLLVSGFASTAVGAHAGSVIMKSMINRDISLYLRRLITIIPAIVLIALGLDATFALIISQVTLSFGIPLALIPMIFITKSGRLMGEYKSSPMQMALLMAIIVIISLLNVTLIALTFA